MTRIRRNDDVGQPNEPPAEFSAFHRAAEIYCAAIEQREDGDRNALEQHGNSGLPAYGLRLRGLLADLLATGYRLPLVEPTTDEPSRVAQERWNEIFTALQDKLQQADLYWSAVGSETPGEPEIVAGSLADDLSDIWRDLRKGLDALRLGAPWQDVSWEWRYGLEAHWGTHAAEALRTLHARHHTS